MSETDLKLICDAIPVSYTGGVSTQANAILKGITGEDVEFDIQTGSQPTLFRPSISQVGFQLYGTNNTDNGAFPVALTFYVDGVERQGGVLTLADDGKVATVTASSSNFIPASNSVTIKFYNGIGIHCNKQLHATENADHYYIFYLGTSNYGLVRNTSSWSRMDVSVDGGAHWTNVGHQNKYVAVYATDDPDDMPLLDGRVRVRNVYTNQSYTMTLEESVVGVLIGTGDLIDPSYLKRPMILTQLNAGALFKNWNGFNGNNGVYYLDSDNVKHYTEQENPHVYTVNPVTQLSMDWTRYTGQFYSVTYPKSFFTDVNQELFINADF